MASQLMRGFRGLVVNGPRQAGKSTLLRRLHSGTGQLVDLDDATLLDRALDDPAGLVNDALRPTAIDEFQRGGPGLLLAVKRELDHSVEPGQFVLAGSTRFLTMQSIADTLTGRVGVVELLPFSVGEARGSRERFVDDVFAGTVPRGEPVSRSDYAKLIETGGFPELVLGPDSSRFRSQWCAAYLATVTARANVDQVADVRRVSTLRALVDQVSARSSQELVVADLACELQSDPTTVSTYLDVLETLYVVRLLPAWSTSRTNRSKQRASLHMIDTALACHSLGETAMTMSSLDSRWFGPLLESFVVGELAKQVSWTDRPTRALQYRDRDGREIDVVLERGQQVVGIEVKATATPLAKHAQHLAYVRDRIGDRFTLGIVLHTGTHHVRLGDRLIAAPISSLWGADESPLARS